MPITIQWHDHLPVLMISYQGELTSGDYRTMCMERTDLIQAYNEDVIIVEDMQDFAGFPSAIELETVSTIVQQPHVKAIFIVLPADAYKRIRFSTINDLELRLAVYFFPTVEKAIEAVHQRLE